MEAKFLTSALSFLSIFLAIYAQSFAAGNDMDSSSSISREPEIYYGDSYAILGEPFSITCIIPITEKIHWLKDGNSLYQHNLRHNKDEHDYTLTESAIEGENHKIEAHLSVRHALKVHEGRYKCSKHHTNYHMLHVRTMPVMPPANKPAAGGGVGGPTESGGYKPIDGLELTPNSVDEIFTRTWAEQKQTQHHQHKQHNKHLLFGNSSSSSSSDEYGYLPAPTSKYADLTTMPWQPGTATATAYGASDKRIHRVYSATPPDFPPPRINMLEHTLAPPEPPTIQLYNQTMLPPPPPPPSHHYPHVSTASSGGGGAAQMPTTVTATTTHHQHQHRQHQHELQQQVQHTLNNFQLPLPPHPQSAHAQPQPAQPASGQHHRNDKYQTYSPQFITPTVTASSTAQLPTTSLATSGYIGLMQQPKTFLPVKKGPESLVPNYDNEEHQMKFYDIRTPLVLSCDVKGADSSQELIWEKKGVNVKDIQSLNGRYRILKAERKFIIDRAEAHDDGLYSCVFNDVRKNINVIARVVVRVPSNSGVVEGEKLSVVCTVVGTAPQLSWSFGNWTLTNSTDRYILKSDESNIENAILMIENVTLDDRGEYKCIGRNAANDFGVNATAASDFTLVRVKGKLAALWPFLGICAEVLILCLIILIYEKRRNKSELEESDTDPQEQKKKRRNYD